MFSATLRATPPNERSDATGFEVAGRSDDRARYLRSTAAPPMQITLLAANSILETSSVPRERGYAGRLAAPQRAGASQTMKKSL